MDWSLRVAILALVCAVFAIWRAEELARFLHLADYQPTKAWKKKISAAKHIVNHKPDDKSSLQYADKRDLEFLGDFWKFADYLNNIYENAEWSFQNSGRVEVGVGSENGASRVIEIRYNQQQTGRIVTSSIGYGEWPVRLEIDIVNARHFQSYEILGLAETISQLICHSDEMQNMRSAIQAAMLDCLWQSGPESLGNPTFNFLVSGNADSWLQKKEVFHK